MCIIQKNKYMYMYIFRPIKVVNRMTLHKGNNDDLRMMAKGSVPLMRPSLLIFVSMKQETVVDF